MQQTANIWGERVNARGERENESVDFCATQICWKNFFSWILQTVCLCEICIYVYLYMSIKTNGNFANETRIERTRCGINVCPMCVCVYLGIIILGLKRICICKNFNLVLVNVCTILWIYPKKVLTLTEKKYPIPYQLSPLHLQFVSFAPPKKAAKQC